jgi:3-oxoacyl-[acyl-carrier-protein] synthase III
LANITILGTGSYLPGPPVGNDDLAAVFGREVEWLAEMLGAESRHFALDLERGELRQDESNAQMAAEAARRALADAEAAADSIDLLVMATCTPDYVFPATALFVQELLGMPPCCVLELRAGCGGMAQAFVIAQHMLAAGSARQALLVGSDLVSPFVSLLRERGAGAIEKDFLVSAAMFGDGAGALVVGVAENGGRLLDARCWSVGPGRPAAMLLRTGAGGKGAGEPLFQHDFQSVVEHGAELVRHACSWLEGEGGYDLGAVDCFIPPQVSGNLTSVVADELGIPAEKVVADFARVGNTVSASIYVALDRVRRDGTLKRGDALVLLPAEATKWICGCVVLRWGLDGP